MDYPSFDDALGRFRSFLDRLGFYDRMEWVCPADVLLISGECFVRPRAPAEVKNEIAATYQEGTNRRLGVKFSVLGLGDETVWCYVYVPTDRTDAEYSMMPDGLKLSVPTEPQRCRSVLDDKEWAKLQTQDNSTCKLALFS